MAAVTLTRTSSGGLLGITVFLDGAKVGRIGRGDTRTWEVEPGAHRVTIKRPFAKVDVDVEVGAGEEARLTCAEESGFGRHGVPDGWATVRAFGGQGLLAMRLDEVVES